MFGIGQAPLVEFAAKDGDFPVVTAGTAASIIVDDSDWPGVIRAVNDFQTDITRVTGLVPVLRREKTVAGPNVIIIGTIGGSPTH